MLDQLTDRLSTADRIRLFLDYDGTLADFAPTPDVAEPKPAVIDLLNRLKESPRIQIAIVSGRVLSQLQVLAPVTGILLAGTYGIEMQTETGEIVHRLELSDIRPTLDDIKPHWQALIDGRSGFFIEDKGWALALHARFAEEDEANDVLKSARDMVDTLPGSTFRLLPGHRFFEVGPTLADKRHAVAYILDRDDHIGALPVYVGDDARDEEAFEVITQHGGICVVVASSPRDTLAEYRLNSPKDTRRWLETLIK